MLFFSAICLMTTSSGSVSSASWPCFTALGVGRLSYLTLLNVMIALTSSIREFGSLEDLTSCSPLGFGCV